MSGTNGVPDPNTNSTWAWDHHYYNRAAREPAAWDPTDDDTFALLAANSLEVILDERAPDLAKKQPPPLSRQQISAFRPIRPQPSLLSRQASQQTCLQLRLPPLQGPYHPAARGGRRRPPPHTDGGQEEFNHPPIIPTTAPFHYSLVQTLQHLQSIQDPCRSHPGSSPV